MKQWGVGENWGRPPAPNTLACVLNGASCRWGSEGMAQPVVLGVLLSGKGDRPVALGLDFKDRTTYDRACSPALHVHPLRRSPAPPSSPPQSPTNVLSAAITVLGVSGLVASAAVWPALTHDVALASQRSFTFKAAKMAHVPVPALCLRAFWGEDDLGVQINHL